jgi:Na+-driven multidrug efflux pump
MKVILGCLGLTAVALIVSAAEGWIVMVLWNWIMPYLFKLPEINFWMALGLLFLVSMLFGALRGNNSSNSK